MSNQRVRQKRKQLLMTDDQESFLDGSMFSTARAMTLDLMRRKLIRSSDYIIGPCLVNSFHNDEKEKSLHILRQTYTPVGCNNKYKPYDEEAILLSMRLDYIDATDPSKSGLQKITSNPKIKWQDRFQFSNSCPRWINRREILFIEVSTTNLPVYIKHFEPIVFRCDNLVVNVGDFIAGGLPISIHGVPIEDALNDIKNKTLIFSECFNNHSDNVSLVRIVEDIYRLKNFTIHESVCSWINNISTISLPRLMLSSDSFIYIYKICFDNIVGSIYPNGIAQIIQHLAARQSPRYDEEDKKFMLMMKKLDKECQKIQEFADSLRLKIKYEQDQLDMMIENQSV
jgi:hypothetical protein